MIMAQSLCLQANAGEADGPYTGPGGCKTWDKFGKTRFPNAPFSCDDSFHVGVVTPVIHHTMGGLDIDEDANVVDTRGRKIHGLYAAGEVAAGPGGGLAGNDLLECVVFGRVAGKAAANFMLPEIIPTSLVELSGKLVDADTVVVMQGGDESSSDDDDGGGGGITVEEVAQHNAATDVWIIVNNKVLAVACLRGCGTELIPLARACASVRCSSLCSQLRICQHCIKTQKVKNAKLQ